MKISDSPCTMRNWNVDVLLHPLQGRVGYNRRQILEYGRRHFHQLFHQLRSTEDCASSAGWTEPTCRSTPKHPSTGPPSAALGHRETAARLSRAAAPCSLQPRGLAAHPGWVAACLPCPASVPVGLRSTRAMHLEEQSGAWLRTGPSGSPTSRGARKSAAGAPSSAVRSQNQGRDQHKRHPLGYESSRSHKQGNACFESPTLK